jgi:hypothetical protein
MSFSRTPLRAGLAAIVLTGLALAATACDMIRWNTLEDGLRQTDSVTEVTITGGSGNVTVIGDNTVGVDVRRMVRYANSTPGQTMSVSGSTLHVDTDCGNRCSASYEVHVARGVKVTGRNDSGNLTLRGVSDVDVEVDSGNIRVDAATGTVTVKADSGNLDLRDIAGVVRATVSSGNIEVADVRSETISLESDSGNIDASLPGTANLTARADSGEITVRVPDNCCRITANADSGEENLSVAQNPSSRYLLDLSTGSGNITVRRT